MRETGARRRSRRAAQIADGRLVLATSGGREMKKRRRPSGESMGSASRCQRETGADDVRCT
jgi:hypothetical protein